MPQDAHALSLSSSGAFSAAADAEVVQVFRASDEAPLRAGSAASRASTELGGGDRVVVVSVDGGALGLGGGPMVVVVLHSPSPWAVSLQ
jgi:hypothetical protein